MNFREFWVPLRPQRRLEDFAQGHHYLRRLYRRHLRLIRIFNNEVNLRNPASHM